MINPRFGTIIIFLCALCCSQTCNASAIDDLTREFASKFDGSTKDEIKTALGLPPDQSNSQNVPGLGTKTTWLYYKGPKDPDTEKPLRLSLILWEGRVTSIKLGSNPPEITRYGSRLLAEMKANQSQSGADELKVAQFALLFFKLITTH